METVSEIELQKITSKQHPDYFYEASVIKNSADQNGESNFLTLKDAHKLEIKDEKASSEAIMLDIQIAKCNNQTSNITCGSEEEITEYL